MIKTTSGSSYVVHCRSSLSSESLEPGTRVAIDMMTKTIMRILPRPIDVKVHSMLTPPGKTTSWDQVGGLDEQVQAIREVVELPLTSPELFERVGITPPKGVLLFGPPGTGKTLIARTLASQVNANFLHVVGSSISDKYIGEGARIVREMFNYARDHQPCVIFIDEVDSMAGKRQGDSSGNDRESQRTLMELLNQLDGFKKLEKVVLLAATNRPDTLDPAFMRPGRIDRKIEIPLPPAESRLSIMKIHTKKLNMAEDIDLSHFVPLTEGYNGADLARLCEDAALMAIRAERDTVTQEDLVASFRRLEAERAKIK